ncbi:uncharacterized protein CTRU02_213530 [Colletotrichum truncatum]|uniref:Uncharacterized protein n=1 Tax=Colletotrichum truncatum TaxID=5467 RepID=A0ACC3YFZ0_COLTU|nr:uncharacterized protein CTRU02_12505 [Colletotrichum truncatum]KAF6784516.1 hypothetical protein CTRU02_12505 [Colletotrichum truncatum]
MANSKPLNVDAADALQGLINDALVQTGKALKSWSKDGRHQVQAQISLQTKMPEIIESFHWKLDDLESEITRAKAALQRDLDRLQELRRPVQQPAPVEAQTKSPMAIDIDSSPREPSPDSKSEITEASGPHRVPAEPSAAPSMAPFPDMGVSFQPQAEPTQATKQEPTPTPAPAPPAMMAPMGDVKPEANPDAATTQTAGAPEAPMDDLFGLDGDAGGGTEDNGSEFHFTDMTFSLAPPNSDSQDQSQTQDTTMDMSFGTADMGGDILSLDSLLPPDNNAASNSVKTETTAQTAPGTVTSAPPANQEKPVEAKAEKQDSTNLDDLFNMDANTSLEGMDLDMNMSGDGGDGSTFDDMYFGDMTEMEHGKFDDAFFGIQ